MPEGERRLAAIMFTDIVGYTSLTQNDESLAMRLLEEHRSTVRPLLDKHGGREVKTIGDAFLVEFPSALEAVRCAFDVQQALHEGNSSKPAGERVIIRIGIHLGDVIHDKGDVYGDAVNLASRIEPLAPPEGICITEQVQNQVKYKLPYEMVELGPKQVKNVKDPVNVYRVVLPWESPQTMSSKLDATRVAVLPFANFSPDPNDEYFADGITEEIISTVSGVSGLSVISRTSVMGYKGTTKKVRDIGKELEVGSVLEGSLRKAGNRIRITTQLIDVAGDKHLWAQNYDRQLDDVFEVQSDIAKQVAEALRVKILPRDEKNIEKVPTRSAEAHTLYLKGRYHWNQRSKDSMMNAIEEYKEAIALDPTFALAYSGIADCYAVLVNHQYVPRNEGIPKVREFALKALELDDSSAEAHTSLGSYLTSARDRSSEGEFQRAIELNPSYATAHHWYAIMLLYQTPNINRALEEALKAQALDPLSSQIASFVGSIYFYLRRFDEAEKEFNRALELQPDHLPSIGNLIGLLWEKKRFEEARVLIERFRSISHNELVYNLAMSVLYAKSGRTEDARRSLSEADALGDPDHLWEELRIAAHISLGEYDKAIGLLQDENARGTDWLGDIAHDPTYDPIRGDPRIQAILMELGVLPSKP